MREKSGVQPAIKAALELSSVERALSTDVVSQGEVVSLHSLAHNTVSVDGVESRINGLPATVTKHSVPVTVGTKSYNARVFRGRFDEDDITGIVFDETSDIEVVTPNPLAIYFGDFNGHKALIVDDEIPYINELHDVMLVTHILNEINSDIADYRKTQLELQKQQEISRKQRRQERIQNVTHFFKDRFSQTKEFYDHYKIGLLAIGAMGILGYGALHVDWEEFFRKDDYTQIYDQDAHDLPDGTIMKIGETKKPEFSTTLYNLYNRSTSSNRVPILYSRDGVGGFSSSDDISLTATDGLRQVSFYGLKDGEGEKCQKVAIDRVPEGTELLAWTDFTDKDGNNKAESLSVTYNPNEAVVCWNGNSYDNSEKPRVVLKLATPNRPQPATSQPK